MSGQHADALRTLEGWVAPTPAQRRLQEEYAEHLRLHPDGLSRSCRPDHITASTLVLSTEGGSALLTLHAKAHRWFQLGGHVEPTDDTLASAALREAVEESGIPDLELDPVPIHLDAHHVGFCGGSGARHLDVRFLAVASAGVVPALSEESKELRWWPVEHLPGEEESLRELVHLGLHRLRDHRATLGA